MLVAVGTYSTPVGHLKGEQGRGLYTLRVDPDGKISPSGAEPLSVQNPSYLCRHPTLDIIYAALETTEWEGDDEHSAVAAIAFDRASGALRLLNTVKVPGGAACHITCDGTFVFAASYFAKQGKGFVHLVSLSKSGDGSLGDLHSTQLPDKPTGAAGDAVRGGFEAGRQDTSHVHSAMLFRKLNGDSAILVADLGCDMVHRYAVDAASQLVLEATVTLPVGSGPRHVAVDEVARKAYVICELTSTVHSLSLEAMTAGEGPEGLLDSASTLPKGVKASTCAAVKLSPDRTTLYGSNRGDDSLAVFKLAPGERPLAEGAVQVVTTAGKTPRDFFVGPNGKYVLAMNQDSGTIARLALDDAGRLSAPGDGDIFVLPAAVCMIQLTET